MTEKEISKQTKHKTPSDKASLAAKPESKLEEIQAKANAKQF